MAYLANLTYTNQGAIRSQPLTQTLEQRIRQAVGAVFGPNASVKVYSGGQSSTGSNRVGTHAHDNGNAGDLYIYDALGKQIRGDGLGKIAQYWQAQKWGGTGLEMKGGGLHLDTGNSRSWDYSKQGGSVSGSQLQMIAQGKQGIFPTLFSGGASNAPTSFSNSVVSGGAVIGGYNTPSPGQPLQIGVNGAGVTLPNGKVIQSSGNAGTDFLNGLLGTSPLKGADDHKYLDGSSVTPGEGGLAGDLATGIGVGLSGFGEWAMDAIGGPLYRILFVIIGLVLLIAGLWVITRQSAGDMADAVAAAVKGK